MTESTQEARRREPGSPATWGRHEKERGSHLASWKERTVMFGWWRPQVGPQGRPLWRNMHMVVGVLRFAALRTTWSCQRKPVTQKQGSIGDLLISHGFWALFGPEPLDRTACMVRAWLRLRETLLWCTAATASEPLITLQTQASERLLS